MPRLQDETVGTGDQRWLGSTHGMYNCRTSTLDISAFTEATHYPDGYLPSGLPVNAADESAVTPYSGGSGQTLGFLYTDQNVAGDEDISVPVFRHGIVNVTHLPVEFSVPTDAGPFVFVGDNSGGGGDNGEEG